ncbi:MAG TPA: 3-isopropylmalate dehydratase small subunit [Methylophaga aminisulfidivorans]|uniref:3-isopropylmalate dehydratase small subunit n=1 Tax=Methylophaga TaxID=40222 RepID=UPI0017573BBA|nr:MULTISPECIES: 3-isopropylmalate dehydratase small subunit [Methylophaga]HIC45476.1 3-isopropylmalate dehydratase small subunit [Methylophaga sp.]HIM40455.1 3-isopropylmalate dehydratase small subunit [Methylophaga aminisulfidivorans]
MQKFSVETGIVIPLDRPNVDTDAIIPKQFLKSIKRTGFGPNLFDEWRYLDHGEPGQDTKNRPLNPDFELNQPRYKGGTILLARENFGCGSSREHAVWALDDFGIRVIIAPSFADIFFSNTSKNGILAITLEESLIDKLFEQVESIPGYQLTVDLPEQKITLPDRQSIAFDVDAFKKHCLIEGLDDIGLTLQHTADIKAYEEKRKQEAPWLFS